MEDRLQKIADRFCAKFGLNRVMVKFAEELTAEDIKIYNFLFCHSLTFETMTSRRARKQLAIIPAIEKRALAEAKKNILWKEVITNPKIQSLTAVIIKEDAMILEAAIYICKNKFKDVERIGRKFGLKKDEIVIAEGIANKMKQFHAEGLVIKEFTDLVGALRRNVGKMPLVKGGASVFEQFVHETIHYVLIRNGIAAQEIIGPGGEPFDEGICTYLHFRFRWSRAWFFRMYQWGRGKQYRIWSRYFKFIFQNVLDREIGPLLKKNQKAYAIEMAKRFKV